MWSTVVVIWWLLSGKLVAYPSLQRSTPWERRGHRKLRGGGGRCSNLTHMGLVAVPG
jgi:hypothetical protein